VSLPVLTIGASSRTAEDRASSLRTLHRQKPPRSRRTRGGGSPDGARSPRLERTPASITRRAGALCEAGWTPPRQDRQVRRVQINWSQQKQRQERDGRRPLFVRSNIGLRPPAFSGLRLNPLPLGSGPRRTARLHRHDMRPKWGMIEMFKACRSASALFLKRRENTIVIPCENTTSRTTPCAY